MALTQSQIDIVKSTVPILKQHGNTITTIFYQNLFNEHPELKNYFSLRNQATGAQQAALAASVFAYATYIDDLPKLQNAVERIAQKHTSLFIRPEHYPIVGKHLVGAFAEVLGDGLSPEVADAWTAAYAQLADIFVAREKQIYNCAPTWQSWRDFTIAAIEDVAQGIVSFYLEPEDGMPVPSFLPGQYVSVQIPIPELGGLLQSRQYSLSTAPGEHLAGYRITIKREGSGGSGISNSNNSNGVNGADASELTASRIAGVVGNRLHDHYRVGDKVQVSPPRGEFVFDATKISPSTPVALISAGVGATPLLSILYSIWAASADNNTAYNTAFPAARSVTWVHAARNSGAVCYGKQVRQLAADAGANITAKVFLDSVTEADTPGIDYDYAGFFDMTALLEDEVLPLGNRDAEYFICGPKDWMLKVRADLYANGVDSDKVHLELFATGDV